MQGGAERTPVVEAGLTVAGGGYDRGQHWEDPRDAGGRTAAAQRGARPRASCRRGTAVSAIGARAAVCDRWIRESLGGAAPDDRIDLARLRGVALAAGALTLAMTAWKAIGPLTTSDVLLVAAVVLLSPRFDPANARTMLIPALAVTLIAIGGVTGTVATSAGIAESSEVLVRFVVASLGAMVLVVCWRPGLRQIRSFSWLWIAGGVISAIVALVSPDVGTLPRAPGLTPHPNHLATISVILLGVTIGMMASDRRRTNVLAGLLACSVLLAAIIASGSRAGLVAALIVVLLALIATRDRFSFLVAVAVVGLGLAFVVLGVTGDDNALERLNQQGTERGPAREAFNAEAWERFKAHPVTGAGFADALEPHNFFLLMGSSAGLLGIIGAVMLVALALRSYLLTVPRRLFGHPPYLAMAAGLSAAVLGYLASSVFQNVVWDRNIWMAIAIMTWTVAAVAARDRGPGGESVAGRYDDSRRGESGAWTPTREAADSRFGRGIRGLG